MFRCALILFCLIFSVQAKSSVNVQTIKTISSPLGAKSLHKRLAGYPFVGFLEPFKHLAEDPNVSEIYMAKVLNLLENFWGKHQLTKRGRYYWHKTDFDSMMDLYYSLNSSPSKYRYLYFRGLGYHNYYRTDLAFWPIADPRKESR